MMKIDLQITVDKDVAKGELNLCLVTVRGCEVVVAHGHCGRVVGVVAAIGMNRGNRDNTLASDYLRVNDVLFGNRLRCG